MAEFLIFRVSLGKKKPLQKMPSTDGAVARDGSPGPSRLKNFKNTGKDMEVSDVHRSFIWKMSVC